MVIVTNDRMPDYLQMNIVSGVEVCDNQWHLCILLSKNCFWSTLFILDCNLNSTYLRKKKLWSWNIYFKFSIYLLTYLYCLSKGWNEEVYQLRESVLLFLKNKDNNNVPVLFIYTKILFIFLNEIYDKILICK